MENWHDLGKQISRFIRPSTYPLAVKLAREDSDFSKNFKRPPVKNFLCQNLKMARTYGWTINVFPEDCNCLLARAIFQWDNIQNLNSKELLNFSVGLYSENLEIAAKFIQHVHSLKEKIKGLIISPLGWTKIKPDVVLIFGNPAQMMRLIQAFLFIKGGVLNFSAAGRMGSCHDGICQTYLKEEPQLVILGNGDRVWGMAQDDELLFSIPAQQVEELVRGLKKTHAAGLRYPIPSYMNFKPGFQVKFRKKALDRAGTTIIQEKNE